MITAFGGCAAPRGIESASDAVIAPGSLSVSDIAASLVAADSDARLVRLDTASIASYYPYDSSAVAQAEVYISADSSKADEVAVFEIAQGQDDSEVVKAVNARVQSKERSFRNISPSEHAKLRTAISVNISGYVVLAIMANSESARSVITDFFYVPESTAASISLKKS